MKRGEKKRKYPEFFFYKLFIYFNCAIASGKINPGSNLTVANACRVKKYSRKLM